MSSNTCLIERGQPITATDLNMQLQRCAVSLHPYYLRLKLCLDWMLAFTLCVLTSPLIAVLALLVRMTSAGPAFYMQTRLGLGGRTFRIIKLRTMRHNCEAATGAVWSLPGDARVTGLGRLLRDTHLDELPQLFNILAGQMAFVGPRPERPEISQRIERLLPDFRDRLAVRPGITGLAQMRLPADTDLVGVRKKLAHDLYYVREANLWLDVKIVFSTAFYFIGAASQALCRAMVRSHGLEVERRLQDESPQPNKPYEMGAA